MPSTRLFVGGLSGKVDRQELGGKLSCYGSVVSIDLKEKTDPEGNVLLRFAYVNVDAAPFQVDQCIQQLNGASWKGCNLRVERAKESFLDRLNRERAAKKQEENTYPGKSDNLAVNSQELNVAVTEGGVLHSILHKVSPEQNGVINQRKRKEYNNNEEYCLSPRKNKILHTRDEISKIDSHSRKEKKKNEIEEKILSSFKQFSSVWADSDNENEEAAGVQASHDMLHEEQQGDRTAVKPHKLASHKSRRTLNSKDTTFHSINENEDTDATVDEDDNDSISSSTNLRKEQQAQLDILESLDDPHKSASKTVAGKSGAGDQIVRDDPIPSQDQQCRDQAAAEKPATNETLLYDPETKSKYVKVSKDLSFGQSTSGFSLLAQFSQMNKEAVLPEAEKEEVVAAPVTLPRSLVTVHQKVKKRPFFISGDHPEIEAAIKWMAQPITEEVIKEFEEALPDLRQVIRTRSFRAKKEEADPRMQRRGRGRGRGRGQGRGQGRGRTAGDDTGNPYRDHRWRERDVKN